VNDRKMCPNLSPMHTGDDVKGTLELLAVVGIFS
jgi:hypothetical protein